MLRHKGFWVALLLTAFVWLMASMSETQDYPLQVRVRWTGYDSVRYVVAYADTVIPLTLNSNCFAAIAANRQAKESPFVVKASHDTLLPLNAAALGDLTRQLSLSGIRSIASNADDIRLVLTSRSRRAFHPQLRNVSFQFAERHGLAGPPVITPDSVWLYGSDAALDRIREVVTQPSAIVNISKSSTYRLALNPSWKQMDDVRSSADSIDIYIPIAEYVEKELTLPVRLLCADRKVSVRLFPDRVTVRLLVPANRFNEANEQTVAVAAHLNPAAPPAALAVRVAQFPACARIKSVTPDSLQYVILK